MTEKKVELSSEVKTDNNFVSEASKPKGFIEKFSNGKLYGWVFDENKPDTSFAIQLYCDGRLVGAGMANIFRGDLKEAGYGNGKHGFVIRLNPKVLDEAGSYSVLITLGNSIEVTVNEFVVTFDEQSLSDAQGVLSTINNENASLVRGCIEKFENGKLFGWVYNEARPDDAVAIKVYCADIQVASCTAEIYRVDLKEADFGNGCHAFCVELSLPILFDGNELLVSLSLDNGQAIEHNDFLFSTACLMFDSEFVRRQIDCDEATAFNQYKKAIETNPDLSCHPLFEPVFYRKQLDYLNIKTTKPLILHYLTEGWKRGIDPHPLFDTEYYRNILGIGMFEIPPLQHYLINTQKQQLDASLSPFFDEKYYNHHCFISDEKVQYASRVHDFILREKYFNFHPDISQQSIGPILKDSELLNIIERDGAIVPQDVVKIIANLRLASLNKKVTHSSKESKRIKLSVIILNYNKLVHTLLSSYCAFLALQEIEHELIVVDNGSDFFCYQTIARYLNGLPNCRVLRIERNRFFGEGNNIALDQAKGDYISFLNNDAYVNRSTFKKLLQAFEKDKRIAATGPVFMQHNYTLQEFGGKVSGCGQVIQIGKHAPLNQSLIATINSLPNFVDYCSAACCVISRSVLEQVGGFDYIFEPFYYEDTDLFSRVRCAGYALYIEPEAHVMHFENTSTKSYLKNDEFHSLIAANRRKFANRWFGKLEHGDALGDKTPRLPLFSSAAKPVEVNQRAFVYSPFPLGPGGGEKYILTLASVLAEMYQTTIIFSEIYSQYRLKMVGEDLGVSVDGLTILTWNQALKEDRPDVFVVMGNEIIPPVPAIGQRNFYHCQFPFPLQYMDRPDALESLNGFEGFIVNSEFTRKTIQKQLKEYGLPLLPVHIAYPPCWDGNVERQLEKIGEKEHKSKQLSILNVGRFFRHGHNKRQDIVLDIIEQLKNGTDDQDWQVTGTLLGGLSKSEEDYYKDLLKKAVSLNVVMSANVERSEIEAAYQQSDIYIHAAGFGKQEGFSPHELEHFGITVIEAMINGVIPLVYKAGGPLEIVNKVGVGETFEDVDEAVSKVLQLIQMPIAERQKRQEKMLDVCREFSVDSFSDKIHALFQ